MIILLLIVVACLPMYGQGSSGFLLFTDSSQGLIYKANRQAYGILSSPKVIIHSSFAPQAVTYDPKEQRVYWSDTVTRTISRAFLNGSLEQTVVRYVQAVAIAVDSIGRNLYWADNKKGRIEVARLDGTHGKTLVRTTRPTDMALDLTRRQMYWSSDGFHTAVIERSSMDGTDRQIIVSGLVYGIPSGLCLDSGNRILYWTEKNTRDIFFVSLDHPGGQQSHFQTGSSKPFRLTILDQRIYWTDRGNHFYHGKVVSVNATTKRDLKVLMNNVDTAKGIYGFAGDVIPKSNCSKNNGGCSHLCLLNPREDVCACSKGMILKDDRKTCHFREFLLVVDYIRRKIFHKSLDDLSHPKTPLALGKRQRIITVDFDPQEHKIYWTNKRGVVSRAFLNGSSIETVVNGDHYIPRGLAVDAIGRNIYWFDSTYHEIGVCKLDGSYQKILMTLNDQPKAMVLDTRKGVIYWASTAGRSAKIERAQMNGDKREVILRFPRRYRYHSPRALAVDSQNNRLYWVDNNRGELCYTETNPITGQIHQVGVSPWYLHEPFSLALKEEFIYWGDGRTIAVYRVNKTATRKVQKIVSGVDPDDLHVYHNNTDGYGNNHPCAQSNGWCTHLCLLKPGGYSCVCPSIKGSRPCYTTPVNTTPAATSSVSKPSSPSSAFFVSSSFHLKMMSAISVYTPQLDTLSSVDESRKTSSSPSSTLTMVQSESTLQSATFLPDSLPGLYWTTSHLSLLPSPSPSSPSSQPPSPSTPPPSSSPSSPSSQPPSSSSSSPPSQSSPSPPPSSSSSSSPPSPSPSSPSTPPPSSSSPPPPSPSSPSTPSSPSPPSSSPSSTPPSSSPSPPLSSPPPPSSPSTSPSPSSPSTPPPSSSPPSPSSPSTPPPSPSLSSPSTPPPSPSPSRPSTPPPSSSPPSPSSPSTPPPSPSLSSPTTPSPSLSWPSTPPPLSSPSTPPPSSPSTPPPLSSPSTPPPSSPSTPPPLSSPSPPPPSPSPSWQSSSSSFLPSSSSLLSSLLNYVMTTPSSSTVPQEYQSLVQASSSSLQSSSSDSSSLSDDSFTTSRQISPTVTRHVLMSPYMSSSTGFPSSPSSASVLVRTQTSIYITSTTLPFSASIPMEKCQPDCQIGETCVQPWYRCIKIGENKVRLSLEMNGIQLSNGSLKNGVARASTEYCTNQSCLELLRQSEDSRDRRTIKQAIIFQDSDVLVLNRPVSWPVTDVSLVVIAMLVPIPGSRRVIAKQNLCKLIWHARHLINRYIEGPRIIALDGQTQPSCVVLGVGRKGYVKESATTISVSILGVVVLMLLLLLAMFYIRRRRSKPHSVPRPYHTQISFNNQGFVENDYEHDGVEASFSNPAYAEIDLVLNNQRRSSKSKKLRRNSSVEPVKNTNIQRDNTLFQTRNEFWDPACHVRPRPRRTGNEVILNPSSLGACADVNIRPESIEYRKAIPIVPRYTPLFCNRATKSRDRNYAHLKPDTRKPPSRDHQSAGYEGSVFHGFDRMKGAGRSESVWRDDDYDHFWRGPMTRPDRRHLHTYDHLRRDHLPQNRPHTLQLDKDDDDVVEETII